MNTGNIEGFLATAYSDEQLVALLEHLDGGKLSYYGCSCLVGGSTAKHPLSAYMYCTDCGHVTAARELPFGLAAEREFFEMGIVPGGIDDSDIVRRKRLRPLILAEMERRFQPDYDETPYWTDNHAMQEMVRDKGAK